MSGYTCRLLTSIFFAVLLVVSLQFLTSQPVVSLFFLNISWPLSSVYIYTSNRSALVCECKDLDALGDDLKDCLDEDERRKTVVTVERVPH